jgi:crotonobetainyl-CoA:carnitine CoA-transferase CaiB-like acyl-CoA transferase
VGVKPLSGVRVLAVEQFAAGPFATLQLAELGAEVIKIEDPATGGDIGRYVPPFQQGEDSLFFEAFNQGKSSISLALDTAAGQKVFRELVARADAVFANVRGDVPERLGLRYEDLRAVNPTIVCCFITGYGTGSSRRAVPGYDYLLQGQAGWMSLTGEPDGPPAKSGLSLVDLSTGYAAGIALLAGLHAARRDGVGCDCEASLFDVSVSLLGYVGAWQLSAGFSPPRTGRSAHPSLVPFESFPTADGWMVVGCAKEKFWTRLVQALGREDLASDPRFRDFNSRRLHRPELIAELDAVLGGRCTKEWVLLLEAAGVPCAPVLSVPEALTDPFVGERDLVREVDHPRLGRVRRLASALRVGRTFRTPAMPAPDRGRDNDRLLHELGYEQPQIQQLSSAGAFGHLPHARE